MNLTVKRAAELGAMLFIGDGVIGAAVPGHHIPVWRTSFPPLRAVVEQFDGKPLIRRRIVGMAQVALGLAAAAWVLRR